MKNGSPTRQRSRGIALIEAAAFLFIALVLLGAALALTQSRRTRTRKTLYRTFAETEHRALELHLAQSLASNLRNSNAFPLSSWDPSAAVPPLTWDLPSAGTLSAWAPRTTTLSSTPSLARISATPRTSSIFGFTPTLDSKSCLDAYWNRISLRLESEWNLPQPVSGGSQWHCATPITLDEIPLSLFTFYSQSSTILFPPQGVQLGRARFEKATTLNAYLESDYPVTSGETLTIGPLGALAVRRQPTAAHPWFCFGPQSSPFHFSTQGTGGLVVDRDSGGFALVRPIPTPWLFATSDAPSPDMRPHQLRNQVDAAGTILHEPLAPPATGGTFSGSPLVRAALSENPPNEIQLDLSSHSAAWPKQLWVVSNVPALVGGSLRIVHAGTLQTDLSIATNLDIVIVGPFNAGSLGIPVKSASLLTPKRVWVTR
ncbi:MAG: hypothetical protein RLZZ142_430 [Verrucomicrobiota bacterium]